jgi:hypothetical protein
VEKVDEGVKAADFCDGTGGGVDKGEIGKTAETGSDVAAAYVKGDEVLGVGRGQDVSCIWQRTFVAYECMRLLALDSWRDSNRMNTPLEVLLNGDIPGAG